MTKLPYPRWRYYPSHTAPPPWVLDVVAVFAPNRAAIDSGVTHAKAMKSDGVLKAVAGGLQTLGFAVETGKKAEMKLPRPVFFGEEGKVLRSYEIDAFQAAEGIAPEVEAGRATKGNNIYRDLIQASLMIDARFLALAVPVEIGT